MPLGLIHNNTKFDCILTQATFLFKEHVGRLCVDTCLFMCCWVRSARNENLHSKKISVLLISEARL